MAIHEVLAANRDQVMRRWKALVRGPLDPDALATFELFDHLPKFLDEIRAALRAAAGLAAEGPSPAESKTASAFGEQRLRLGFSLDAIVREYGALHDAIIDIAKAAGVEVTFAELRVLFDCIITGIAHAVSEYTRQRDAELLRQANEHFAFIAHELRNPLTSATMAFQLLKRRSELPEDSRATSALERALARSSELIDQTLQTARIASGIQLRRTRTSLKTLFEEAESSALAEAESRNVQLAVAIEADQQLSLDERLVGSAVGNLLRNGVKYTAAGSRVELRGRIANGFAVIEIEDRCGGLPPGKVEEVFAPFVRLETDQAGFGLGLAIAKQAAAAHGGTIRVQNLPGRGCIFVLELPVSVL